jgi:hypothetical protein
MMERRRRRYDRYGISREETLTRSGRNAGGVAYDEGRFRDEIVPVTVAGRKGDGHRQG